MNRLTLILLAILIGCCDTHSQEAVMVVKKKQRSIQHFWKDSYITFQEPDKEWTRGIITKITPDSFYMTKEIIRYGMMQNDTLHFSGFAYALTDVYAMPTKREQVVYRNDQVHIILGREPLVWLKNGTIFQIAGAGYVTLNIVNNLIDHDPPFAKENLPNLAIGAAVFLFGKLLQHSYYPHLRIGKKYRLECIMFSDRNGQPPMKNFR